MVLVLPGFMVVAVRLAFVVRGLVLVVGRFRFVVRGLRFVATRFVLVATGLVFVAGRLVLVVGGLVLGDGGLVLVVPRLVLVATRVRLAQNAGIRAPPESVCANACGNVLAPSACAGNVRNHLMRLRVVIFMY